jgi:hypothetical protein
MFFTLVTPAPAFAGWGRAYGGSGIDFGRHILKCSDGNYAILGGTSSFGAGGDDIWLLKISEDGDTLWTRTYGGGSAEYPEWIEETPDSGFIILGTTASYGSGESDIWLVKTDKNGNTQWTKTYGGAETEDTSKNGFVSRMLDNRYLVVGETESYGSGDNDLWILITDSLGDTISTRTWGDSSYNRLCCANRTIHGYTVVEGSGSAELLYFISLDSVGEERWSSEYTQSQGILPLEITFVQNGHDAVVVAGSAYSDEPLSGPDPWSAEVICTPSEVIELWARTCLEYDIGIAYCIQPTKDTCYILTGKPWPIFKTSKIGILGWSKEYDGNGKYVIETSDGGYLVTGDLSGDLWLLKTDSNGDTLGIAEPPSPAPSQRFEIANPIGSEIILRYSNCVNGFRASVYDASGRKVDELHSSQSEGTIQWGGGHGCYGPGVYFIVVDKGSKQVEKVVLVR